MKSLLPWHRGHKKAAPATQANWWDRWGEDPFATIFPSSFTSLSGGLPSVDVSEDKKEVTVRAEIPGMSEKDIDLSWHDGVLHIRGEKKDEKESKNNDCFHRECRYGAFARDIPFGTSVDWNKAKARYKHGVLTVTLPRTTSSAKAIDVKIQ
ncbi:MAG: Hsp20 family protein [Chitinivibrionales bacterium]|nr:Hsp20 family protein [Chitinivibrionales bacterium]